jgi:hypothetical protein
MPVKIEKSVYIKDKEGHVTILTESDTVAENTDVTMTCDSARCASRHDGKHVEISWNLEAIQKDANALSDDFYRLISLLLDSGNQKPTQKTFCSPQCVRDFLQYEYVSPLSPREQALLMAQNRQAEIEKHRPAVNVIPFRPQPEPGTEIPPTPEVAPTFQDPAKDYQVAVDPAEPGTDKTVEECVGEQPTCEHCCEHKTEPSDLLPELPSDVTPYDPDEVPF